MALETVDILIEDDEVVPNPIEGAVVRVFDATGTTYITEGTTIATGHVEFTLDGDDPATQYSLRFYKLGMVVTSPQAIEVYSPPANSPTGTNTFSITGTFTALPTATDPRLCRVSGYIKDGAGRPRSGIDMHFIPQFNPLIVDNIGILGERVTHRTDKQGFISIDLWRNGCYLATIESHENITREVVIPDRSSIDIMPLLFPVVEKVEYLPAPTFVIPVGTEIQVIPTITASDFQTLSGAANGDVLYTSDNEAVAYITIRDDSIFIRGNAVGSANLNAVRKDLSIIHVPDPGIDGGVAAISVV